MPAPPAGGVPSLMSRLWEFAALGTVTLLFTALALTLAFERSAALLTLRMQAAAYGGARAGAGDGSFEAALRRRGRGRQPAHVVLLAYPKSGSTSLVSAIHNWNRSHGASLSGLMRFHIPTSDFASYLRAKDCTEERWCLIISTARKPGPALLSFFFHRCRTVGSAHCKQILRSTDNELERQLFDFGRRGKQALAKTFYAQAHRRLREARLDFDVAALGRHGLAVLPNAAWVVLRFEQIEAYGALLGRWLPGVRVPSTLNHSDLPSAPQYERLAARLSNESRWPEDLRNEFWAMDVVRLFYPDGWAS